MSTVTPRLNLVKPTTLEQYALSVFNNNMDLIDSGLVLQTEFKPTNWTAISLTAAWVAYTGGGNYFSGLRGRVIGDNVQVMGMVKSGAAGSAICTLPAALRPEYTFITVCEINAAGTLATILFDASTGVVTYRSGAGAPTYLNINVMYKGP